MPEKDMEASTELLVTVDRQSNTTDLLAQVASRHPSTELYAVPDDRSDDGDDSANDDGAPRYRSITAVEFEDEVKVLARGLIASGLKPSDTVAVLSSTSYEWALVDFAIWYAGGITVPIYESSSVSQIAWILQDSDARHVFVQNNRRRKDVQAAAEEAGVSPSVWLMSDEGYGPDFSDLRLLGESVSDQSLEAHRSSNALENTASIVYTSGTVDKPKGCVITHGNFTVLARNSVPFFSEVIAEDARTIMFLPLAHVLARAVQIICVAARVQVLHVGEIGKLMPAIEAYQPTFLLCVPRIYEKIFAQFQRKLDNTGLARLFSAAVNTAVEWSELRQEQEWFRGPDSERPKPSFKLRARHLFFDRLLFSRLRSRLGGQVRYTICGASALDPRLAHFFRGAGIPVLEGYGLTETTAPATVNIPASTKVGTVGIPLPGTSVRLSSDGEILLRGIGVFDGYYKNEAADREAMADGWFRTGDLGSMDDDGFLSITGRIKDLIVTAGGKNVSPGPLEEVMRRNPLVEHAVVVGEGQRFVAALIWLNDEELASFAQSHGLGSISAEDAASNDVVRGAVQEAIDEANATVSQAESVRRFRIIAKPLTLEDGHLTESMKIKRPVVAEDFSDDIDALYETVFTS